MRPSQGFTLIELMIVVAIISVIIIIAIPSMLRARMAANETAAVASCKALAEAEEIYKRADRDNDGIMEYAQTMSGNNSLLETTAGLGDLAIIDKTLALAEGDPATATTKSGYVFKILTSQGTSAEGGSRTYMTQNPGGGGQVSMVLGYGVSCIPGGYDLSGRSAFMVGGSGTIYQKDRGVTGVHEPVYNPDPTWTPAE